MNYFKNLLSDKYRIAYMLVIFIYLKLSDLFSNYFYSLISFSIFAIVLYFVHYKKFKPKYITFLNIFLLFVIIISTIYQYTK